MRTQLLYLDDSYQKEMDAKILEIVPDGQDKYKIILDSTVFYAMGGGQPTDQGILSSDTWNGQVYQVMIKDGELWYFVKASTPPILGDHIHGVIDWERRYRNMRYHTGGHIIDFAIFLLGYCPKQLSPIKADHGKKPYIVYQGLLHEDIQAELQAKVDELIVKDMKFSWEFQPYDDLKREAIYLQPGLPANKPLRTFRLEGVGAVADGGTQLHSTSEAGKVIIDSIQQEEGNTIISYSLPS
jgi:alanyl-tRNA synthetase